MFDRTPKLCVNCKHLSKGGFGLCYAPQNHASPVTGEIKPMLASASRSDFYKKYGFPETTCGPEGKFFEPIENSENETFWQSLMRYLRSF